MIIMWPNMIASQKAIYLKLIYHCTQLKCQFDQSDSAHGLFFESTLKLSDKQTFHDVIILVITRRGLPEGSFNFEHS